MLPETMVVLLLERSRVLVHMYLIIMIENLHGSLINLKVTLDGSRNTQSRQNLGVQRPWKYMTSLVAPGVSPQCRTSHREDPAFWQLPSSVKPQSVIWGPKPLLNPNVVQLSICCVYDWNCQSLLVSLVNRLVRVL